jgi:hypothetical protein
VDKAFVVNLTGLDKLVKLGDIHGIMLFAVEIY